MSFQLHKSFVRLRNTITDILDKNQEACDCPIDCQVNNTVEVQTSMKSISREVHLPSGFNLNFMMRREYLLYAKKKKYIYFFFNSSSPLIPSVSPRHCRAILEIMHRTQTAYAVLYPPQRKDAYSTCIYALIFMKIAHPCVEADAEERTLLAFGA